MIGAKSTLFTRFDTEDKVAECRNREGAPTSGAECCSRISVEQGQEAHTGDSGTHQPGEEEVSFTGSVRGRRPHSTATHARQSAVAHASYRRSYRSRLCSLERVASRRRDQLWQKLFWDCSIPRLLPTGQPSGCGRSIRVVTPYLDLTGSSSPQSVDPHLDPGLLHGNRHHVPQCSRRLGHQPQP